MRRSRWLLVVLTVCLSVAADRLAGSVWAALAIPNGAFVRDDAGIV